ncbi:TPA: hypothetical protein TXL60_001288 [Streptococcus suis]|uniref:DUF6287 domain-containing protein n=1 Tax=Streptococcus suis TaxID=1307 RepID=UPI0019605C6E|nr:DUF6287 domain-containing protein [Streptococcus suis]MBM7154022.1 hypothetical protein [Streptococcus suis]MDG4503820.1 DUF6287 domain-containing protein [Streptococcus suis]HEL1633930.1 hypothetical protein [Streptococcus suis]
MTEKEWISYFEAINRRKPTDVELKIAFKNGEIRKKSYGFRFRSIPSWKQISVILLIGFLLFLGYKPTLKMYYHSQESRYRELYETVISSYQEAILQKDSQKVSSAYFEQPTRIPSYLIDDLDDDGKVEMYIGFDDGVEKINVLEQFDISFGKVKRAKAGPAVSSDKKWSPFDVEGLYQIDLTELSNQDFSSVSGVWVSEDGESEVTIYDDGIAYINGVSTDNMSSDSSNNRIIGDRFGFLNISKQVYEGYAVGEASGGKISLTALTNLGFHYTYSFVPKGIDYSGTDSQKDRVVVKTFDGEMVLYSSSDVNSNIRSNEQADESAVNLTDLLRGDFSSLAGTWKNSYNSFTLDEKGSYRGTSSEDGLAFRDLRLEEDNYIMAVLGDSSTSWQNANSGAFWYFIPAGIKLEFEQDTDSSRDRFIVNAKDSFGSKDWVYYKVE